MPIDLTELRSFISDMYSDVARFPRGGFHFPTGRPIMEKLGYPADLLDRIPTGALESFAGVGYHLDLDPLKTGERVVDIGSGAGADACAAGLAVGETGEPRTSTGTAWSTGRISSRSSWTGGRARPSPPPARPTSTATAS